MFYKLIKRKMKIWIEVELHSSGASSNTIREISWLSYNEFRPMVMKDGTTHKIGVKMSEEYYPDTIEYNFTPFDVTIENFSIVKEWLEEQKEIHGLSISAWNPKFCWTHIHIFDKDKLSLSKSELLTRMLYILAEDLDGFQTYSVERIMRSHQLWTYWCHSNNNKWYSALWKYGYRPNYYQYHENTVKYQPIYDSPKSNKWKPKSLEIRIIPNEYIFNMKAFDIMKSIEDGSFFKGDDKMKCSDFIKSCWKRLWMKTRAEKEREKRQEDRRRIERYREDLMPSIVSWDEIYQIAPYNNEQFIIYKEYSPYCSLSDLHYSNRNEIIELWNSIKRNLSDSNKELLIEYILERNGQNENVDTLINIINENYDSDNNI